jgi:hypothetical protein
MSVFCEQCGREADAAAKFCSHCGVRILPETGSSSPRTSAPAKRSAPDAAGAGLDRLAARVAGTLPETRSSSRPTIAPAERSAPDAAPVGLDRLAARVAGKLPEAASSPAARTASGLSATRNGWGGYVKWGYVGGMALVVFGVRFAFFVTRITTNLLTGQTSTSYPDLGIGIVLVVIGIFVAGGARLAEKGWLR